MTKHRKLDRRDIRGIYGYLQRRVGTDLAREILRERADALPLSMSGYVALLRVVIGDGKI